MSEALEKNSLVPKLRFPGFEGEWKRSTIGTETRILKGRGISKADIDPNGKTLCIRYGELYTIYGEIIDHPVSRTNLPATELFFSETGDVIIPSSGETKEDIATSSCVMLSRVALGGDLNVLRSENDGRWLSYYIKGKLRGEVAKVAQGDSVVHLYPDQIAKVVLCIPSDTEQRKIAACLQSLDELIAAETEKLEALKRHKKGLLQQLFPAEGETTPRLRFPQCRDAGEWKTTTLKSVAFISSGTTPSRTNAAFFANGSIPWVKTMDLNNSEIHHTGEMVTEDSGVKINPPGSVLVAMYGGFNQIGRTGILKKPSATNQAIAVLRPKPGEVTSGYILLWLNAKVDVWKRVAASSRKDANITSNDVASFEISVPMLESEQTEMTIALDAVEAILAGSARSLQKLRSHKAALMQQLFPSLDDTKQ